MKLLDELRGKLRAFEWEPALDPDGRRALALSELIRRFEAIEAEELSHRHPVELRLAPPGAVAAAPRSRGATLETHAHSRERRPLLARPLSLLRRLWHRDAARRAQPSATRDQ
jgi:hypothetical protein